jgi:hypothetical protein
MDGGLLELVSALGVFGAAAYLCGLLAAIIPAFSGATRQFTDMPLYGAVIVATFCQLPFSDVYVGESGFGAWLFVGLAASATPWRNRSLAVPLIKLHFE